LWFDKPSGINRAATLRSWPQCTILGESSFGRMTWPAPFGVMD
jgi:hypothetical protein